MASTPLDKKKDAHYHAIQATVKWSEFVSAMRAAPTRTVAQDAREVAQRKRETTYARGELGGH